MRMEGPMTSQKKTSRTPQRFQRQRPIKTPKGVKIRYGQRPVTIHRNAFRREEGKKWEQGVAVFLGL